MLNHPSAEAPVLVDRAAFARLVAAAERATQDPATLDALVEAVRTLEAERHATEWDMADAGVAEGTYFGDEDGYQRAHPAPDLAGLRPDMPPARVLFRSDRAFGDIIVADEPPVPVERIARLEALGIAAPSAWVLYPIPYRTISVSKPLQMGFSWRTPRAVAKVQGPPGGAWLVSGPERRPFAWFANSADADYTAASLDMVSALSGEVTRFGGGSFTPQDIIKSGFLGLIRALRWSVEPGERWEREPPEALRAVGVELEKRLVEFLAGRQAYRSGGATPP